MHDSCGGRGWSGVLGGGLGDASAFCVVSAGPADGVCGRLGDGGGSAGGLGQVQQGGPRQVAGFRGEGELEYGAVAVVSCLTRVTA